MALSLRRYKYRHCERQRSTRAKRERRPQGANPAFQAASWIAGVASLLAMTGNDIPSFVMHDFGLGIMGRSPPCRTNHPLPRSGRFLWLGVIALGLAGAVRGDAGHRPHAAACGAGLVRAVLLRRAGGACRPFGAGLVPLRRRDGLVAADRAAGAAVALLAGHGLPADGGGHAADRRLAAGAEGGTSSKATTCRCSTTRPSCSGWRCCSPGRAWCWCSSPRRTSSRICAARFPMSISGWLYAGSLATLAIARLFPHRARHARWVSPATRSSIRCSGRAGTSCNSPGAR